MQQIMTRRKTTQVNARKHQKNSTSEWKLLLLSSECYYDKLFTFKYHFLFSMHTQQSNYSSKQDATIGYSTKLIHYHIYITCKRR